MATRVCSNCLEELDESMFNKVGTATANLRPQCAVCRKELERDRAKRKNEVSKKKLEKYGCCVCGATNSAVLEVHHLHISYKRYGRSQSALANLQDVEKETAVVLCANDHSLFHSHFGGKNAPFPPQTKQDVINICMLERAKGGL